MKIDLIAVGTRMPGWVSTAYAEYAQRLPAACALNLREIPLGTRSKGGGGRATRAVREEGERMLAAIPTRSRVVALELRGTRHTTEGLSVRLSAWLASGQGLSLLVGGPDGLAGPCVERADESWSLSPLTLPHGLVRVVVAEQLYRAWSILEGHPYHRSG